MATKQIALGTVLGIDTAGGTNTTTVTLAIDATPPARKRVNVDQTALSDTLATYAPGIEDHSEWTFNQYWHPTDTMHASIDTAFGSKTSCGWKITYPFSSTINSTFTGYVSALEPATLQTNGMVMRKVTIQRTGDISTS